MKTRKGRVLLAFTAVLIMLMVVVNPVHAILGVGDIVFDPANYVQNLQIAIESVQEVANEYIQIENEFAQLADDARNLTADHTGIAGLHTTYQNLLNLNNYLNVLITDYAQAQAVWDRTFPKFAAYNGQISASAYADHVNQTWQNTNTALLNSVTSNALVVSNHGITKTTVDNLLSSSDTASGALQAAQIGHKLAAVQVEQLAEISQIMSQSANAQASYCRYQMDKDDQAQTEAASMQQLQNINNPSSSGVGELIP